MTRGLSPKVEYEVMEATRAALGERGVSGLTLDEVAQRADCTNRVYEHYDSPDDLVTSFVKYEHDRFEEFLMVTADDPASRLRALLDVTVDFTDAEDDQLLPAYLEMYARAEDNDALRSALLSFDSAILDALVDTIEEGIEAGAFRDVDAEKTATMIFAAHESSLIRKAVDADTAPIKDSLDEFVLSELRQ
jgi:AcrR family transcriptional regulator